MMGNLFRFSATLLTLACWAPELLAQDRPGLDPSWTDGSTPDADREETPSPAPPDAALPPPPAPPPGAAAPGPMPPPAVWIDPYGRVRVFLHGDDPRMRFAVFSRAKGADKVALFACGNPCPVMLPPGEYRVHISGVPKRVTGEHNIEVMADSSYYFSLPEESARTGGLALAITGTALIPVGFLLVLLNAEGRDCGDCGDPDSRDRREAVALVGFGMIVTGAVLTPVGWVQFARNRKPHLEQPPFGVRKRDARAPRFGVGAAPLPGGAAAGVWGTF